MIVAAALAGLVAQDVPATRGHSPMMLGAQDEAEFRSLVRAYSDLTTPHCRPDLVEAYRTANAGRDRAFVDSLRGTPLRADYDIAVADVAYADSHTQYECAMPPSPPSAPGQAARAPEPASKAQKEAADRQAYFAHADRDFAMMLDARNKLINHSGN